MNQQWLEHQVGHEEDGAGDSILPWFFWAVVIGLVLGGVLYAGRAVAEPMAKASVNNGQVVITIYTEDCALKNVVTNLPKRATWVEGGKTYEGCAGVQPDAGVAMFYFSGDKTIAIVPLQMFARVVGA